MRPHLSTALLQPRTAAYRFARDGDLVSVRDAQNRNLIDTDDAGLSALADLVEANRPAESLNLRHRHSLERLHVLPQPDGSLLLIRRDSAALDIGEAEASTVDAEITLRRPEDRRAFVTAARAHLNTPQPKWTRPEDELWSAH